MADEEDDQDRRGQQPVMQAGRAIGRLPILRQAHQAVAPLAPTRVRVKPASWASARG